MSVLVSVEAILMENVLKGLEFVVLLGGDLSVYLVEIMLLFQSLRMWWRCLPKLYTHTEHRIPQSLQNSHILFLHFQENKPGDLFLQTGVCQLYLDRDSVFLQPWVLCGLCENYQNKYFVWYLTQVETTTPSSKDPPTICGYNVGQHMYLDGSVGLSTTNPTMKFTFTGM